MIKEKKQTFSLRLTPRLRGAIEIWAGRLGLSIAEFVRAAVVEYARRMNVWRASDYEGDTDNEK